MEESSPEEVVDTTEDPEPILEEDPTEVRRPLTEKLLRTMQMSFNQHFNYRKSTIDRALHAHDQGRKVFWEVYSGSGHLADYLLLL